MASPPHVRAYELRDINGRLWLYNAGVRESSASLRHPQTEDEKAVIETMLDLVNGRSPAQPRYSTPAFSLYLSFWRHP